MQNNNLYPIFGIICLWLLILSVLWYRFYYVYRKLVTKVGSGDIKNILEKLLINVDANTKDVKDIYKRIKNIEDKDKLHIQKIALVKFNPFSELGGDHSFCLAVLNDNNTGVIITGLHTRERTRVYIKEIKNGKSTLELSTEEKKALDNAQKEK